jgi:hypothetical protein
MCGLMRCATSHLGIPSHPRSEGGFKSSNSHAFPLFEQRMKSCRLHAMQRVVQARCNGVSAFSVIGKLSEGNVWVHHSRELND